MTERNAVRAEIKRRLNSYRDLQTEHEQLTEELKRVEALMSSPTGSALDGMPRNGSNPGNPVERVATQHMELLDRYRAQIVRMVEEQSAIEAMIQDLEPTERKLARFRYIDGLTWEEVCDMMAYSWRQTHRIHGKMLDKLTDRIMGV